MAWTGHQRLFPMSKNTTAELQNKSRGNLRQRSLQTSSRRANDLSQSAESLAQEGLRETHTHQLHSNVGHWESTVAAVSRQYQHSHTSTHLTESKHRWCLNWRNLKAMALKSRWQIRHKKNKQNKKRANDETKQRSRLWDAACFMFLDLWPSVTSAEVRCAEKAWEGQKNYHNTPHENETFTWLTFCYPHVHSSRKSEQHHRHEVIRYA